MITRIDDINRNISSLTKILNKISDEITRNKKG